MLNFDTSCCSRVPTVWNIYFFELSAPIAFQIWWLMLNSTGVTQHFSSSPYHWFRFPNIYYFWREYCNDLLGQFIYGASCRCATYPVWYSYSSVCMIHMACAWSQPNLLRLSNIPKCISLSLHCKQSAAYMHMHTAWNELNPVPNLPYNMVSRRVLGISFMRCLVMVGKQKIGSI